MCIRDRSSAARHANAFKINEDVVIPLERMGDYTDAIERINIELSFKNKLRLLDELQEYLAGELQLDEPSGERKAEAQQVLAETRARWAYLVEHLDTPLVEALPRLA